MPSGTEGRLNQLTSGIASTSVATLGKLFTCQLRSTRPFILYLWINWIPAARTAGIRAGDAACAGWQVTLCVIPYGMQAPIAVHKLLYTDFTFVIFNVVLLWQYVTEFRDLSTYRLEIQVREMSSSPILVQCPLDMARFTFLLLGFVNFSVCQSILPFTILKYLQHFVRLQWSVIAGVL